MYYLNSRYYNPEIGRFINADGLLGKTGDILSHNMYAYTQNNPVMMVDPSGEFLISGAILGGIIVGALAAGTAQVYSNAISGKEWHEGLVGAMVGGAMFGGLAAGTGGVIIPGFAAGISQSLVDQGEDMYREKSWSAWSTSEFLWEAGINSALNIAVGAYAAKRIPINTGWIKPTYLKSFFTKSWGQHFMKQTAYAKGAYIKGVNYVDSGASSDLNVTKDCHVNTNEVGFYLCTYSVTDSDGDKAFVTRYIDVINDYSDITENYLQVVNSAILSSYNSDNIRQVIETSDGNYLAVGFYNYNTVERDNDINYYSHGLIVKYDKNFNIIWKHTTGSSNREEFYSVIETDDGDYYVVGRTNTYEGNILPDERGISDGIIIKLSSDGEIKSTQIIDNDDFNYLTSIQKTNNDKYLVKGYFVFTGLTIREFSHPELILDDDSKAIDLFTTNNEHIHCDWYIDYRDTNIYLEKKYQDGSSDRVASLSISDEHNIHNLYQTTDGNFIILGSELVIKISNSGDVIWEKIYDGYNFYHMIESSTGNFIFQTSDGIITLNNDGEIIYTKEFEDSYNKSLIKTTDDKMIMAGINNHNAIIMELENKNYIQFTGIENQTISINDQFNNKAQVSATYYGDETKGINFTVEGEIDTSKAGLYTLYYVAEYENVYIKLMRQIEIIE